LGRPCGPGAQFARIPEKPTGGYAPFPNGRPKDG
jgi:hypothetical protein